MRTVLVLQHGADIPPGHLGTVLIEAGVDMEIVALDEGLPIPDGEWVGVVSLGGVMGAYEEAAHPWLADEKRFLAEAVDADVPVLGICLGAQLVADALGGRAFFSDEGAEIGMVTATLTGAGAADPVTTDLGGAVPVWHRDTFDVPPGATLLAESDRFPHAFRWGSAVGIQSHPEATPSIVARWIAMPTAAAELAACGIDPEGLMADVTADAVETEAVARAVFGAWVEEL